MDDPSDGSDARALWNGVVGERVVFSREASDGPCGRIEPQTFGNDVIGIRKLWKIVECGCAAMENGFQFGVKFLFGMRVLREQPPRPGKSAGGGFVPSQEKRESFIAELLRGHSRTVFILGMNQK